MSDDGVIIEHGLPDELRDQAAEIFEAAFSVKARTIVRDTEKRLVFMSRAYVAENAVIARRGGQLVGFAGLSSSGGRYAGGLMGGSWDPRPYSDLLGWVGAAWAVWSQRLGSHRPKDDEIYVDGIAVSPEARGLGIGTRLLDEITAIASSQGKRYVRLDVVDTNPRAQALYERMGYKVTKVESFRFAERWAGFGGQVSMELRAPPAAAVETEDRP